MELTGKQRKYLRGLGHHLRPIVQIGQDGVSETVVSAISKALEDHELVKVKVGQGAPCDAKTAATTCAELTGAEVCQVIGGTILLYVAHPKEPTISLPK